MSNPDINLFRDEEFEEVKLTLEKIVCLGMEFESDDARRAYFREELRNKLPDILSNRQKYDKVTNLLASLRKERKLKVEGRKWVLVNG